MTKMKHGVIAVLGMLVLVALTACGDSDSIEGKWKIADIDKDNDKCEISFNIQNDNTYKVLYKEDGEKQTSTGKYQLTDDEKHLYKMELDDKGKSPYVIKIKKNKDSITMTNKDGSQPCTFDKQ